MYRELVIVVLLVASQSIEIAYTLNKLKKFKYQNFGLDDNTSHVAIGTYLHERFNIDALEMMGTSKNIGIKLDISFKGKTKYFKIFGAHQDYDALLKMQPQLIATNINNHDIMREQKNAYVIVQWKSDKIFDENEIVQLENIGWLQRFLVGIPRAILKIPAHFLCRSVGGVPLHEHLNHSDYILEMHGINNPYQTFQSIFYDLDYPSESDGYTSSCPKNPSTNKLREILNPNTTTFNIEKTLHIDRLGYIGEMKRDIIEAERQNLYKGILFFDDHPINVFDI